VKAVNAATANEFHVWQRANLPGSIVMQDLDAWGIVASDASTAEPTALLELKRSSFEPERWRPFEADRPNFSSMFELARRAEIPFYIVYFQKGVTITDTTKLHVFLLTQISPEYHGTRSLMTAAEFKRRFPRLIVPREEAHDPVPGVPDRRVA
jgi:hypothetical protein